MKKYILPLILALVFSTSVWAQSSNVSWGTSTSAPGGLWFAADGSSAGTLTLGYFTGDDSSNAFNSIATLTQTGTAPAGFIFGTTALSGIDYDGLTPWVSLAEGSYVTSSTWGLFTSAEAPTPPTDLNISVNASDVASTFTAINAVVVDGGGFNGNGPSITVPEPSTYALIAGFAAFLFVSIRRRK